MFSVQDTFSPHQTLIKQHNSRYGAHKSFTYKKARAVSLQRSKGRGGGKIKALEQWQQQRRALWRLPISFENLCLCRDPPRFIENSLCAVRASERFRELSRAESDRPGGRATRKKLHYSSRHDDAKVTICNAVGSPLDKV